MKCVIQKMADVMGGKTGQTPMLAVTVTKQDGQMKTYNIPKFKKDVCAMFQNFGPQDVVDVTFEQNAQGFMNPVSVNATTMQDFQDSSKSSGGGSNGSKNKGVALSYVMRYVLPQTETEAALRKMGGAMYIDLATELADIIVAYLEDKEPTSVETDTDIPTPDLGE